VTQSDDDLMLSEKRTQLFIQMHQSKRSATLERLTTELQKSANITFQSRIMEIQN